MAKLIFLSRCFRCLYFSQGGECLFVGSHDVLKVYGWEPGRTLDTIPTGWGKVQDIAVAQNQLVWRDTLNYRFYVRYSFCWDIKLFQIGASFHTANVILYVCDLKKIAPLGGISAVSSPFSHGNSLRKSFSRERPIGLKKHTYVLQNSNLTLHSVNWVRYNIYFFRLQTGCKNDRRGGQIRHGSGRWGHLRGYTQRNRLQGHFPAE